MSNEHNAMLETNAKLNVVALRHAKQWRPGNATHGERVCYFVGFKDGYWQQVDNGSFVCANPNEEQAYRLGVTDGDAERLSNEILSELYQDANAAEPQSSERRI